MGNTNLQELSKAYAEGKLEQEGYRKKRTELLDSITSPVGIEQLTTNNGLKNSVDTHEPEPLSESKNTTPNNDPTALMSNRSPVFFLLVVTAVLLTFVYVLIII